MVVAFSIIVSCIFLVLLLLRSMAADGGLFALWCKLLMSLDVFIFVSLFAYYSIFITVMRPEIMNYLTAFIFALPFLYVMILIGRELRSCWKSIKAHIPE